MKRHHLEYLAAHSGEAYYVIEKRDFTEGADPEFEAVRSHSIKLQANAVRATYELERRDRVRVSRRCLGIRK